MLKKRRLAALREKLEMERLQREKELETSVSSDTDDSIGEGEREVEWSDVMSESDIFIRELEKHLKKKRSLKRREKDLSNGFNA